jgi:hypothetical protein
MATMTSTTEGPIRPSLPSGAAAPRRRTARRAALAAMLALGVLVVGCGDSDSDSDDNASGTSEITQHDDHSGDHATDGDEPTAGDEPDAGDDAPGSDAPTADGVPKECSIYPFAMEPADPDEITLAPASWPAPPAGATLCVTSTTMDSSTEVAEYALGADPETILGYYEAQLGVQWNVEREAGVGNEILTGYDDTVGFQIVTRDGGFKIAFGEL